MRSKRCRSCRRRAKKNAREALWSRLEAASFLTDDEKRAVIGYGPKGAAKGGASPFDVGAGSSQKFNPNHDGLGRFTTGDGAGSGESDALFGGEGNDRLAPDPEYSPEKPGWHQYQSGPNNGCSAELNCSIEE